MAYTNSLNHSLSFYNVRNNRSQLLTWLSPLEPWLRHRSIQERRVKNVGEWVLQTGEFRSWYAGSGGSESDDAVLFCYGDPGVGKTYISSLVIDRLSDWARGQNVDVSCFYFDSATQKEQLPTSMLGALLKQIVGRLGEVPEEIEQAYENRLIIIPRWGRLLSDLVKMLQTTSSRKRTFICIDAIDECVEGHRVEVLDSLNQILRESPGTRIFVTGRPHIRPEICRRLAGRATSISISSQGHDIIGYLHARLREDARLLLVSLNINTILQETTIHRRRQKLSAMAEGLGLDVAYGATLDRIKGQGGERARLGMNALMWISRSERPLKADELCHALAVEIGSPNLNTDNVPSIGILLACCQGLVAVDKETSAVRLIHFTLQEYLRAHPELLITAHSTMAETCLSYLNSHQVKALSASPFPDLEGTPFLEYSSLYWGVHAKRHLSDSAKSLAMKLLNDYSNHISTKILLKAQIPDYYPVDFNKPFQFSGLHCASAFGIDKLVASLVEVEGCSICHKDFVGNTPFAWAVLKGHERVVEILLGRDDVNPDEPGADGQAPLWCAFDYSHGGVVEILLERVSLDIPGGDGQTLLCWAAEIGHEGVVKMLLGRGDVNPDEPDEVGQTPLWYAAYAGREEVVKILLGRNDVNPDKPDDSGQTPLWCAVDNGHGGVVEILLGRVSLDVPRGDGQTLLCWAAESGHEGLVKLLLERVDVSPDEPDEDGQTPLYRAAENGRDEVVKMLLRRDDVNPDKPDNNGETPLNRAAWSGHEGVVKILLGRSDVNRYHPDKLGRTPLWWAIKRGLAGAIALFQS